jgi:hypothetical protein
LAARGGARLVITVRRTTTMLTPTVTEIPRPLSAVGRDTFIDGAGPVPHSRPRSPAADAARALSLAPTQAHPVTRLPLTAQPAASAAPRPVTLTRAA